MQRFLGNNGKNYLILSTSLFIIIITGVATAVTWYVLKSTSQELRETAVHYQEKTELVLTLWSTARTRTISLQSMLIETDEILREEIYDLHLAQGTIFLMALEEMIQMKSTPEERYFSERLESALANAGPKQAQLVELILNGSFDNARTEMQGSKYISTRQQLFNSFSDILGFYRNKTEVAFDEINKIAVEDTQNIFILTGLIILFSTSVGFLMMFKFEHSERKLLTEVALHIETQTELENHQQLLQDRIRDGINKYKQKDAEFNKSRELAITMGNIMEDSLNEIYIFDSNTFNFIQVNQSARENLGYSMDELMQMTPKQLKPEISEQKFNELISPLVSGKKKTITFTTAHERKDKSQYPVEVHLQLSSMAGTPVFIAMILDITARLDSHKKLQLKNTEIELTLNELELQKSALDEHAIVSVSDSSQRLTRVNKKFIDTTHFTEDELLGGHFLIGISDEQPEEFITDLCATIQNGDVWSGIICNNTKNGKPYWSNTTITPFTDKDGVIYKFVTISTDFTAQKLAESELRNKTTEIEAAHEELKTTKSQALQAEKLASVGQLAAGIAHEINTPIQFVGDNTRFIQDTFSDLRKLIDIYNLETQAVIAGNSDAITLATRTNELREEIDIDYLLEEAPTAIAQTLEGVDRVSQIVLSMKDFSHPGSDSKEFVNINKAIESTIVVSRNEWKYIAKLETRFDETLTAVPCYQGEFNQVILNMIINASHAIDDVTNADDNSMGTITIETINQGDTAEIHISDTGSGMTEAISKRIFDPFFTTKGVGKGSGQGLAIAYAVIVEKHEGSLDVESETGKGTTFIITLPMSTSSIKAA